MTPPDDYGLSTVATLAHIADTHPAPLHQPFWARWREILHAARPALRPAAPDDHDALDNSGTHTLTTFDDARLACTLLMPENSRPPRACLVTTHAYSNPPALAHQATRLEHLARRDIAILSLRLRGYPGSTRDTGDLTRGDFGYLAHGLPSALHKPEDALTWSIPRAVADILLATRALRRVAEARASCALPLFFTGESFAAGLALLAASLADPRDTPARLVIGLPTLGDWGWRLARRATRGTGADAARWAGVVGLEHARDVLRLCDAAVHAARVRCPTLCKLASRDDVAPAPAAAGIFNALGVDPAHRWRFLVGFGHHDAGLADARRHALFERCAADFLDPEGSPEDRMRAWEPFLSSGLQGPGDEPGASGTQEALFTPPRAPDDDSLVRAYERAGRTLDDLPYTPEWAALMRSIEPHGWTAREAFHRLHTLRKAGRLPRLGRAPSRPPRLAPEEESWVRARVESIAGSLGQRDRLPFTPEFDRLVEEFGARTGRSVSPHDLWRVIAKLAK